MIEKHLADGATISAVGSGASSYFGWFEFVNDNAAGIGVLLSFFFGSIGLIFYWLTWKKSTLADENKINLTSHAEKLDGHIVKSDSQFIKVDTQFDQVNSGISEILNKLDK
jgi:hypothetical protein